MRALLRGACLPLLVLILWEAGARLGVVPPDTFSRPSDIGAAGLESLASGDLLEATMQTLQAAGAGLLLALVIGVPVGILIGASMTVSFAVSPTLNAVRSVPPVALIPLSLLVFGFGVRMEAAIVAFASVWALVIATAASVRAIEPRLGEVASTLEMGTLAYVRKIVLPAAVARIAVGLRVAIGIALVVAVTVEIVVNPRGLGYLLIIAQQSMRPDLMYAQLFWLGLVGWAINAGLVRFNRTALRRFGVERVPA